MQIRQLQLRCLEHFPMMSIARLNTVRSKEKDCGPNMTAAEVITYVGKMIEKFTKFSDCAAIYTS